MLFCVWLSVGISENEHNLQALLLIVWPMRMTIVTAFEPSFETIELPATLSAEVKAVSLPMLVY